LKGNGRNGEGVIKPTSKNSRPVAPNAAKKISKYGTTDCADDDDRYDDAGDDALFFNNSTCLFL
jgi:hypothetical protein